MNENNSGENFRNLTVGQMLELASGGLDDQQLVARLVRRLELNARSWRARLTSDELQDLKNLCEVTDRGLAWVVAQQADEAKWVASRNA